MGMKSGRHLASLGAVAVVVLWIVGFFLAGKPPKFDASADTVVSYYADHHKQVLIAVVLVAIGLAIYLCVMSQLSLHLRGSGQRSLAPVILVGAGASAGLFAVGNALYGVIAQAVIAPGADPGLAKALYQLDQFAGVTMYWLILPIMLSVAIAAHRGVFPVWSAWVTWILAVLVVLGGVSVKATGAFAAGTGPIAGIAFGAALVFLLEVGVLLWTAKEEPTPSES
jgi:hypothetical protein